VSVVTEKKDVTLPHWY